MTIAFGPVTPIFRIFDVAKALEFYVGYLGFEVAWQHRFEPELPLYMEIRRGGLTLHLSEHYGDGAPGAHVRVSVSELGAYHAELVGKAYGYLRPGIERGEGGVEVCLLDPFGNRLTLVDEPSGA